ncbi:MAG: hypothetical protein EP340_10300 [Alphaproteobacteria bacterium]|nr:MAG: hypothetical protein EP340_10300 [Alphaproteobacteria bacterium]
MGLRGRYCRVLGSGAALVWLLSTLPALAGAADDAFEKGVAAFDQGDFSSAYAFWLPLAENGDLAAQRNVAHLLRKGLGVERDPARAFDFYKASAEAGLASAQVNLAALYESGMGTQQSDKNAVYYYARAAKAGHANAQYRLALMAMEGRGMDTDPQLAHALLAAAAAQEHSLAKDFLRRLEARTEPVELGPSNRSTETASRTVLKLNPGIVRPLSLDARSQMTPGQITHFESALEEFAKGERGEALESLRRLSAEGIAEAQFRTGEAYFYGVGAPQNLASAFAFFQIANASQHPEARQMMKKTLMEMQRQAIDQMDSD